MSRSSISADLIRGHIDTIILRLLTERDHYGYEIMKAIYEDSDGRYELKEPSLYTSLRRLEGQKLIRSYWGDESRGARRKYYTITEAGRRTYEDNLAAWRLARDLIDILMERKDGG